LRLCLTQPKLLAIFNFHFAKTAHFKNQFILGKKNIAVGFNRRI